MRIDIDINDQYPDTSVTIHAPRLSQDIEKMIAMMRMLDMQISAERNGETYILDANQILYIEAVERKTFIYTETDMYESELKLYEVEEQLLERDFLRISKQRQPEDDQEPESRYQPKDQADTEKRGTDHGFPDVRRRAARKAGGEVR